MLHNLCFFSLASLSLVWLLAIVGHRSDEAVGFIYGLSIARFCCNGLQRIKHTVVLLSKHQYGIMRLDEARLTECHKTQAHVLHRLLCHYAELSGLVDKLGDFFYNTKHISYFGHSSCSVQDEIQHVTGTVDVGRQGPRELHLRFFSGRRCSNQISTTLYHSPARPCLGLVSVLVLRCNAIAHTVLHVSPTLLRHISLTCPIYFTVCLVHCLHL